MKPLSRNELNKVTPCRHFLQRVAAQLRLVYFDPNFDFFDVPHKKGPVLNGR